MTDDQSFSIISGILFGEKGYMDEELYEEFQLNGIAHVLAVSGLHVGLVYSAIRKLFKRSDITASLISIILLAVYACLANFSVSVIRASLMIVLHIIAFHIHRRYDMLSAASFTAIIMLMINPHYLFDSGAQLSFLAAYSLAVIDPWFELKYKKYCDKKRNDRLYKIGKVFIPGLSLQIGMAPLMAFHFLNFAPLSLLINPIAIYIASLILPFGIICFLVYPFNILLAGFSAICEALCFALNFLCSWADKICGGFSVPAPSFGIISLFYLLLFFYFSEARFILLRKGKEISAYLITFSLIALSCLGPYALGLSQSILPWKHNRFDFVFVDVGQGDCTHINSNNVNVLIDGGGSVYKDIAKDTLKPYLLKNGVTKIDLAFVSHLDTDHSKGIEDLSKIMKIQTIVFPVSAKNEDLSSFKAEKIVFAKAEDKISAGDLIFTVISPYEKNFGAKIDTNAESLVLLCENDNTKALFMADLPIEQELNLNFIDVDILKVGHHGSKTSTSEKLLTEARPEIAVISCGKNNRYGHPTDRVLELLQNSGIIIKRTDSEGAICIKNKNILTKY